MTDRTMNSHCSIIHHWIIQCLIVSTLALICYIESCWGEFVFDDLEAIVKNNDVHPNTPLSGVFQNDFWGKNVSLESSHKSYRPLTVLTFRWNYWLGGLDPYGFHLTNVVLHVLISLIFLRVCSFLYEDLCYFTTDYSSTNVHSSWFALFAAVLFATHPVHTETVAGVVGRAELTSAMCFFTAFLLYRRNCYDGKSVIRTVLMVQVTVVLAGCAMLFKEQGITIIGLCLVYDIVFMEIDPHQILLKKVPSHSRTNWTCFVIRVCSLVLSSVILIALRLSTGSPTFKPVDNPASFENSTITRVVNYNYLYSLNAWLLLDPWWLCFDWSMGCVPLITTVDDKRIFAVIAFWIVFGSLTLYCVFAKPSGFKRITTIALAMLVVPFLPASNMLLQVGFVLAERILYIPSCGFCLLVSLGMVRLSKYVGRQVCAVMALVIVAIFISRSIVRTNDWLSEDSLFTSGIKVCPLNAKVLYNIAKVKSDNGDSKLGETAYREAIRLYPEYDQALNNLGNLLKESGRYHEAEEKLFQAVTVSPSFAAAWMNLGIVQASLNKTKAAENSYMRAISHRNKYPDAYYNLGNLYIDSGQTTKAISAFQDTIRLQSDHHNAWSNLGLLYENLKMYDEAEKVMRSAIVAMPEDSHFYYSLGVIMGRLQRLKEGEELLLKSLSLNPTSAKYHSNLGVIYHLQKEYSLAEQHYRKALAIDSTLDTATDNLKKLLKAKTKQST